LDRDEQLGHEEERPLYRAAGRWTVMKSWAMKRSGPFTGLLEDGP
jgi:hypothetical protein